MVEETIIRDLEILSAWVGVLSAVVVVLLFQMVFGHRHKEKDIEYDKKES